MLTNSTAHRLTRRIIAAALPSALAALALAPSGGVFAAQPPTVLSVLPTGGTECGGTNVTITGTNFNGATEVDFGTTPASTFTVQPGGTTITATSPAHDAGTVDVTVVGTGGTSATSSNDQYSYTAQPAAISSVSPTSGNDAGGTSVTINGTCFVDTANIQSVNFGTTPVTPDSVTDTTIMATSPAEAPGTVSVTVKNASGQTSTVATGGSNSYTFVAPATVTAIQDTNTSSTSGPAAGGDTVLITGTGFGTPLSCTISKVTFSGVTATIQPATCGIPAQGNPQQQTIKVTSPAAADQTGNSDVNIQVWDCADCESAAVPADVYTYLAAPTVTSLSPRAGNMAGGDSVTVGGTNFTAPDGSCQVQHVYFGGTNGATGLTNCSATSIDVTTPSGSGIVDVRVVTSGGESAVNQPGDQFTYAGVGVTSVSPDGGPYTGTAADAIKIFGFGFSFGGQNDVTSVTFGTAPGSPTASHIKFVSDSEIDVTAPAGLPGTVDVIVATADNGTTTADPPADSYTFEQAPSVSGVSANFGPAAGGNQVTISGSGFDGGETDGTVCDVQQVMFGSQPATFNPADCTATSIKVTVPSIPTPAGASQAVTVNVFTDFGSDGGTTSYTYVTPPSVTGVSPSSGPTAGGNTVTVSGTHFFSDQGTCDVKSVAFGATNGTSPTCVSDTQLTVTAPSESGGSVDVTVTTNRGGTSATNPSDAYTFTNQISWQQVPGSATDIAVDGVYVLGTNSVPGGHGIWQWTGSGWNQFPGGGTVIAVDSNNNPWVVNSTQQIWAWNGSSWTHEPGSARYIAAGADGSIYVLGTNAVSGGYGIWKWNPGSGTWGSLDGGLTDLAVGSDGSLWGINSAHAIYHRPGSAGGWSQVPGSALEVTAGNYNTAWVVGTNPVAGGDGLWAWNGSGWGSLPGGAVDIAVNTSTAALWAVNSAGAIYTTG